MCRPVNVFDRDVAQYRDVAHPCKTHLASIAGYCGATTPGFDISITTMTKDQEKKIQEAIEGLREVSLPL